MNKTPNAERPLSRAASAEPVPTICLVTPVFNGAAYIDDTIFSILSQAGDFKLRYHVQDGGSRDDTMGRVRSWIERSRSLPVLCKGIEFTAASEPDGGMYDAINKGFAFALPQSDDTVMGWIAADDRIAPGGLATIVNLRATMPDIKLLGGRVALLDHSGSIITVHTVMPLSRRCMAAGLYDGRAMPFIMQEGTFWTADLWRRIGGLDTGFKLAGDWDLWRRMAVHENYVSVDSLLGFHRRRPGQLSEHMDSYYEEVDRALDGNHRSNLANATSAADVEGNRPAPMREAYEQTAVEYHEIRRNPPRFRASQHAARTVRYNLETKSWESINGLGLIPGAAKTFTTAGPREGHSVLLTEGFKAAEGPYPEYGLHEQIRWMVAADARGEVWVNQPGQYRVVVRCRSWTPGQGVVFLVDGKPIGRVEVTPYMHDRDVQLSAIGTFAAGRHEMGLSIEQPNENDPYLLMIDWWIEQSEAREARALLPVPAAPVATASQVAAAGITEWPRISIIVPTRNQGHFIRDTLTSIVRQAYPNLELIVVDGLSTDETPLVLKDFAPHITVLIAERDNGQSNAINKGFRQATGEILTWLNSDDLLAEGALHAMAHAFKHSDADLIAGVCEIFDDRGRVRNRHLPCVGDGPLPLHELLDLKNHWLRGQFFHQPEVFFTRDIWERAGSSVDESLFYAMDYDLWVRMAAAGARIAVIGVPIARFRAHPAQKTSTPDAYMPELTAHSAALRTRYGLGNAPAGGDVKLQLKITMFNDYGFKYGAGIAHRRLAAALQALGHEVSALAYHDFDLGPAKGSLSAEAVAAAILAEEPDLVILGNLHSIAADFDLIAALRSAKVPTLFYAHDQWIVTGRCAYSNDCTRFLTGCDESCPTASAYPALPPTKVAGAYSAKQALLRAGHPGFAVLTNSGYMKHFLEGALGTTGGTPVHLAPLGIDTRIFRPGDRWRARMILGLPQDAFVVFTAASSPGDERKGFPLLLEALQLLDDKASLKLVVMGFQGEINGGELDVVCAGLLDADDILVLYYNAADVFVGPSQAEAFGQTFVEAGACGVPSVAFDVGGVSDAIVDGVTGLLVENRTASALATAIQRLRGDTILRRRLGTQARLYAVNTFSLERSAAKLTHILATEAGLKLNLTPNVFMSIPDEPISVRYLLKPAESVDLEPIDGWIPRSGFSEERRTTDNDWLPLRYWWAMGPECVFVVRAARDGGHTLQVNFRNQLPGQRLIVAVNGGDEEAFEVIIDDLGMPQMLQIGVDLNAGLNRVTFRFARTAREASGFRRELGMLIEAIALWPGSPDAPGQNEDGDVELVQGFGTLEGPYPHDGLPNAYRWIIGPRCKMRVYSDVPGKRTWELRLRNYHANQRITISVDGQPTAAFSIDDVRVHVLHILRFEAEIGLGTHVITVEAAQHALGAGEARSLAFIFEAFSLVDPYNDLATFAAHGAGEDQGALTRWCCEAGFGEEEPPLPQIGLHGPFRWALGDESTLRFDRPIEQVQLVVQNPHPDQTLEILDESGTVLALAPLQAGIGIEQRVAVDMTGFGSSTVRLRPSVVGEPGPGDQRRLSFILLAVLDAAGEPLPCDAPSIDSPSEVYATPIPVS